MRIMFGKEDVKEKHNLIEFNFMNRQGSGKFRKLKSSAKKIEKSSLTFESHKSKEDSMMLFARNAKKLSITIIRKSSHT